MWMIVLPSCRSHVNTANRYVKIRKGLPHQRSDVNYQLHIDYPKRQLLSLTLKFPVLRFCTLPPPLPRPVLRSLFSSKSTSWQTSNIISRWLSGSEKGFAFGLCQEPGTILFASVSLQEPFKGNSLVIPQTATQKSKATHPRSHSL